MDPLPLTMALCKRENSFSTFGAEANPKVGNKTLEIRDGVGEVDTPPKSRGLQPKRFAGFPNSPARVGCEMRSVSVRFSKHSTYDCG